MQHRVSYSVEFVESNATLTGHAGLALLVDGLDWVMGRTGWQELAVSVGLKNAQTARRHLISLVALMASGGEHVSDLAELRADDGLSRMLGGMMSSPTQVKDFLYRFHQDADGLAVTEEQDEEWRKRTGAQLRPQGPGLKALETINDRLCAAVVGQRQLESVTLEVDATIAESADKHARWTYKGVRGYQPQMAYVPELGLWVADEFRDGNVPSNFEVLGFVRHAVSKISSLAGQILFRADAAYYNDKLMTWLDAHHIGFVISAPMVKGLRSAIAKLKASQWHKLPIPDEDTGDGKGGRSKRRGKSKKRRGRHKRRRNNKAQADNVQAEWAEVVFVPDAPRNRKKQGMPFRYLVVRRPITAEDKADDNGQVQLFDHEEDFLDRGSFRYFARVTNTDWDGAKIIAWHNRKQGQIERGHDIIKNDLAGASLPLARFGAKAAWWRIAAIAANLIELLKQRALPTSLRKARLKRLRLLVFNVAARVVRHSHKVILRLTKGLVLSSVIMTARDTFKGYWLRPAPS